jgi:transposase
MNTIVGIDVSKDKSSFCIRNSDKMRSSVYEFPMTIKGFKNLLQITEKTEHPQFYMESTGRYHLTLLKFLLNQNQTAYIINPVLVKNYSRANSLRKTKTDKIDATLITNFACNHSCNLRKAEYGLTEEIRSLARRREQLAEEVSKAKTQVKADLCVSFPEILSTNVFTEGMLNLLSYYSSPEAIINTPVDIITDLLKSKGNGRSCSVSPKRIKSMAMNSVGIESYGTLTSDSVRNLISIQEREKKITKVFLSYIKVHHEKEQKLLESIPGVGVITSAHFLAEVGNIKNFPRYQNLIAYCGTDPGIYESGTIHKNGHISKRGNKYLRKYIYLMAMGSIKYCPYFKAYYDRKREEGFPHRKAMVALMNKQLKTIYAVLTKEEPFVSPDIH